MVCLTLAENFNTTTRGPDSTLCGLLLCVFCLVVLPAAGLCMWRWCLMCRQQQQH
jgi:hypothetical protein